MDKVLGKVGMLAVPAIILAVGLGMATGSMSFFASNMMTKILGWVVTVAGGALVIGAIMKLAK